MNVQKSGDIQWFPKELKLTGDTAGGETGVQQPVSSDTVIHVDQGKNIAHTAPPVFATPLSTTSEALEQEKENPHRGLAGKWLQNSVIGLFIGITLLGAAGCTGQKPQPPPSDKPATEQTIPGTIAGIDIKNNEDFQKAGAQALSQLADIAHRYGGDLYGKGENGPTEKPITSQEAFIAISRGEGIYFKGSSTATPVEIKDISQFRGVYKEVLAEVAKAEAQSQLQDLGESLKNTELGQKALTQLADIAQKHGGNLFTRGADGTMTPLDPSAAYKVITGGASIYFQGGKDSQPVEVKNLQQLGVLYQQVLKEAAVDSAIDQGLQWVDQSLQDSEKAQQLLGHLSEITRKFGGNLYGKTKEGPTKAPITPEQAYRSLAKGEGIYLKCTGTSEPIDVQNLNQLGTIYKQISKDIAGSGVNQGLEWAKGALSDSQAARDLLIHLNEMTAKYGGKMYQANPDGSTTVLTPLEAYQKLSAKQKFFYKASENASPVEIKDTDQLITLYMEALKKMPSDQANKEMGKTGDLLQKLMEEQLKKLIPDTAPKAPAKAK